MGREYPVPSSACSTTVAAVIGPTSRAICWFGLATTITASGSATWWGSNASGGGASLIMAMTASQGQLVGPVGPFSTTCGVYVNVVGGSAILWWAARP